MDYMDNVSKRIVSLREEKGETQQELANAIGITRQSLSRYEIAARTVNAEVLGALARHFGVSADYLLGLSDVRSTEQDIRTACEVTGLTEETIKSLQTLVKVKETTMISSFSGEKVLQAIEQCIQNHDFISLLNEMVELSDKIMRKNAFLRAAAKEYAKFFSSPAIADPVEALTEYCDEDCHFSGRMPDDPVFFHKFNSFVWRIERSLITDDKNWEWGKKEWYKMYRTSGNLGYARYRFEKELRSAFSDLEHEMYDLKKVDILQKEYSDILQNHYDLLKSISIAITEEANNHAKMEQETAE